MKDEDYMATDFGKEQKQQVPKKPMVLPIQISSNGLRLILLFWLFTFSIAGLILTSVNGDVTGLEANNHHYSIKGIDTGTHSGYSYYTIMFDMNRTIFDSTSTGASMYPSLWSDSHEVYIVPLSEEEINVGDIISFSTNNNRVLHRVTEIGSDDNGWYVRTKGDNNLANDLYKTRFEDINGLLIAITY